MWVPAMASAMLILGVDFTSAPRPRKPITVASGRLAGEVFRLSRIESFAAWEGFEALLGRPGPWIGGFDFPFGLPLETVRWVGWPRNWDAMVRRCAGYDRRGFRKLLDDHRSARPPGDRFPHRATDRPAGSHSPLKFVNPPVGWMFLEGAPRLLRAGLSIPGVREGDPGRIAVEAYPGFVARRITRGSYTSDDPRKNDAARRQRREEILAALVGGDALAGVRLHATQAERASLAGDPTGDRLDAAIAALQAAWCWLRRDAGFGLPGRFDPCEGWIAGVPSPDRADATP